MNFKYLKFVKLELLVYVLINRNERSWNLFSWTACTINWVWVLHSCW